jgi:hypothetical protein
VVCLPMICNNIVDGFKAHLSGKIVYKFVAKRRPHRVDKNRLFLWTRYALIVRAAVGGYSFP